MSIFLQIQILPFPVIPLNMSAWRILSVNFQSLCMCQCMCLLLFCLPIDIINVSILNIYVSWIKFSKLLAPGPSLTNQTSVIKKRELYISRILDRFIHIPDIPPHCHRLGLSASSTKNLKDRI